MPYVDEKDAQIFDKFDNNYIQRIDAVTYAIP